MTDSHKPHSSHNHKHPHGRPEHEGKGKDWVGEEENKRAKPALETRGRG
jgi:hypothetical protein